MLHPQVHYRFAHFCWRRGNRLPYFIGYVSTNFGLVLKWAGVLTQENNIPHDNYSLIATWFNIMHVQGNKNAHLHPKGLKKKKRNANSDWNVSWGRNCNSLVSRPNIHKERDRLHHHYAKAEDDIRIAAGFQVNPRIRKTLFSRIVFLQYSTRLWMFIHKIILS